LMESDHGLSKMMHRLENSVEMEWDGAGDGAYDREYAYHEDGSSF